MQRGTHQSEKSKKAISLAQTGVPKPKASEKTKKLLSKLRKEWWKQKKESKNENNNEVRL